MVKRIFGQSPFLYLRLNFVLALAGTLGSLYLSEVMKFPPCLLCWYQRICFYPLVAIFGAALFTEDRNYSKYSLPLITAGLGVSIYHNLLYYGVIEQGLVPCTAGVSCSSKQLELFGFITIPLLSLGAFCAMGCLDILAYWRSKTLENHQ